MQNKLISRLKGVGLIFKLLIACCIGIGGVNLNDGGTDMCCDCCGDGENRNA
jgi:hypothetical protein